MLIMVHYVHPCFVKKSFLIISSTAKATLKITYFSKFVAVFMTHFALKLFIKCSTEMLDLAYLPHKITLLVTLWEFIKTIGLQVRCMVSLFTIKNKLNS